MSELEDWAGLIASGAIIALVPIGAGMYTVVVRSAAFLRRGRSERQAKIDGATEADPMPATRWEPAR